MQLQELPGLLRSHEGESIGELAKRGDGRLIEAVVSRSSPMLGKTIREGTGSVTSSGSGCP